MRMVHPGIGVLRLSLAAVLSLDLLTQALGEQQRPSLFVAAAAVVPGLVVEMRYAGLHNFVGAQIDGYERPICLLTCPAAEALARVQSDLTPRGFGLKVFDCYRPVRAVAHFVRWARERDDVRAKAQFYPDVDKRNLFRDGCIAELPSHSRGSTVDLTLVRRGDASELDMGTPFDRFSPRSWPSDREVSADAQENRRLLADAMQRQGFAPMTRSGGTSPCAANRSRAVRSIFRCGECLVRARSYPKTDIRFAGAGSNELTPR
jgi:D-alanyl-D-alanine dipeptidase